MNREDVLGTLFGIAKGVAKGVAKGAFPKAYSAVSSVGKGIKTLKNPNKPLKDPFEKQQQKIENKLRVDSPEHAQSERARNKRESKMKSQGLGQADKERASIDHKEKEVARDLLGLAENKFFTPRASVLNQWVPKGSGKTSKFDFSNPSKNPLKKRDYVEFYHKVKGKNLGQKMKDVPIGGDLDNFKKSQEYIDFLRNKAGE